MSIFCNSNCNLLVNNEYYKCDFACNNSNRILNHLQFVIFSFFSTRNCRTSNKNRKLTQRREERVCMKYKKGLRKRLFLLPSVTPSAFMWLVI